MKKLLRVLRWLFLASCVVTLAAWVSGGWVVTPLVYAYPDAGVGVARRHLRDIDRIVVATAVDGFELTGVHVTADEGAPVVLHLLESGAALVYAESVRNAFKGLRDEGFSSMAFDYRGVGLSGGDVDAGELLRDAEAMWGVAVEAAGGDPSHVILRGCSLGSIVVAMLLEAGHRPGAIMAVAPVEAATVAPRYGKLFVWDPVVWLAQPFLRPVTKASTVESFVSAGVPAFAQVHPEDVLLSRDEYGRWLELGADADPARSVACRVWVREGLSLSNEASVPGLEVHLNLAMQSHGIAQEELEFLASALPWYRPDERRMEALVARADPTLAAEIADHSQAYLRAQSLAAAFADTSANAALVAALQLTDEEFAAARGWIRGPWMWASELQSMVTGFLSRGRNSLPPGPKSTSVEALREIFDLSYGDSRIPIEAITRARAELYCGDTAEAGRVWTPQRLRTLRATLVRNLDQPDAYVDVALEAEPSLEWSVFPERERVVLLRSFGQGVGFRLQLEGGDGRLKLAYWLDPIAGALGFQVSTDPGGWTAWDEAEIDLIMRCIRQGIWMVE